MSLKDRIYVFLNVMALIIGPSIFFANTVDEFKIYALTITSIFAMIAISIYGYKRKGK